MNLLIKMGKQIAKHKFCFEILYFLFPFSIALSDYYTVNPHASEIAFTSWSCLILRTRSIY